jgi:hypothetical protein
MKMAVMGRKAAAKLREKWIIIGKIAAFATGLRVYVSTRLRDTPCSRCCLPD